MRGIPNNHRATYNSLACVLQQYLQELQRPTNENGEKQKKLKPYSI